MLINVHTAIYKELPTKKVLTALAGLAPILSFAQTLCPNGLRVSQGPYSMCPAGTFVGNGRRCTMALDGSFVGGGGSKTTMGPDGTFAGGGGGSV